MTTLRALAMDVPLSMLVADDAGALARLVATSTRRRSAPGAERMEGLPS